MSQNLHFDKYVDLMGWWQEDMHGTRWLWWFIATCAVAGDGDCLHQFFTFLEKEKFTRNFVVVTKPELVLINMFSPTYEFDLITLTCKISPPMPKLISSLIGTFCKYLMRQNFNNRTRRDLRAMNVHATFENDRRKIVDMGALTVIFNVPSWKMRKKFAPQKFGGYNTGTSFN